MGLIEQRTSLIYKFTKLLSPIIDFLFPEMKEKKQAKEEIAINITANIMGIGNAATPL